VSCVRAMGLLLSLPSSLHPFPRSLFLSVPPSLYSLLSNSPARRLHFFGRRRTSSPPRPKMKGSPIFSRTTRLPASAASMHLRQVLAVSRVNIERKHEGLPSVNLVLSLDGTARMLLCHFELALHHAEYLLGDESVGHNKIGGLDRLHRSNGQEVWVSRSRTN
jgi:hypothetical protein